MGANAQTFQPGRKKTGGRPAGTPNRVTLEAKEVAAKLVDDPEYRREFKRRLLAGKLAPALEVMVWHFAYGKPRETVALEGEITIGLADPRTLPTKELLEELENEHANLGRLIAEERERQQQSG